MKASHTPVNALQSIKTSLFVSTLAFGLAVNAPVWANPTPEALSMYNQAAQGDEEMVEAAHDALKSILDKEGATPLTLVYLGSTETLQGRDAFLPWNKMKYVEKGLATIDKSLTLLNSIEQPVAEQARVQGLPEAYLTRAMAATTYTSLPDMFNHFDRGYDLYLDLLSEDEFSHQSFSATAWIYRYAITASIRAQDLAQAQSWLAVMEEKDSSNIETMTAKALVSQAQ
ncbi:hypothetical protein LZI70_13875 [Vibrio pelagius]|uniref:Sel1 repeat family protein n=1 Tax=Vibrio pelagius TaxID=28169 RepID=A0ABY5GAU0_VIBPE|nr:hypothetical protein [Vibrio pelagius]UTT86505.1 hypothetical protein LZI70_19370 [Vibrio pelagius]UTT86532.1 hypothetical protein LZI70_13875 [Vibrio pelagius]